MKLTTINVWDHTQYPWGFQVRADYRDETSRIINGTLVFAKEPDSKALDVAVESKRLDLEQRALVEDQKAELAIKQLFTVEQVSVLKSAEGDVLDYIRKQVESSELAKEDPRKTEEWLLLMEAALKESITAEKPSTIESVAR